jgi:sugar-specific transcriptional regulator TrmB
MIKSLMDLGLSRCDAQIYVYLALAGPKMVDELADAIKIHKKRVRVTAEKLQEKGMLISSSKLPVVFSAVSFDRVLDKFMRANVDEANRLAKEKEKILALWKSNIKESSY